MSATIVVGALALRDGGYFPGATGIAAGAVCLGLLIRITVARHPLSGLTAPGTGALAALIGLASWTLLSSEWSDAPTRALLEFNRTLLYLAVFALLATTPNGTASGRWLLRLVGGALAIVCLVGLLGRLAPDEVSTPVRFAGNRLTFPLGYWNTMGLAAALAVTALLGLSSDRREPMPTRIVTAALVPAMAVTLYLTLSRGSILAVAIGVVMVVVLGRSPWIVGALVATGPTTAVAVLVAYSSESLVKTGASLAAIESDAHRTALVLLGCCAAAGLIRALALPLDRRLAAVRPSTAVKRWGPRVLVAAPVVALLVLGTAFGGFARIADAFDRDRSAEAVPSSSDARDRLTDLGSNARLELWQVQLDTWRAQPLRGTGAGTFPTEWSRNPDRFESVQDGHSLTLETLSELGVVGTALLYLALGIPLVAMAVRRRREDRLVWSVGLAVCVSWFAVANIDWHWEMPAVTLPIFALLGAACARPDAEDPSTNPRGVRRVPRIIAGLAILALAVTPARVAWSQHQLNDALAAFQVNDCPATVDRALGAIDTLGSRPEAFELLAYCDVRSGRPELALQLIDAARRRDPNEWSLRYARALIVGAAGRDPRPDIQAAARMNPVEKVVLDAAQRFDTSRPSEWRRAALRAPLVVPVPASSATRSAVGGG